MMVMMMTIMITTDGGRWKMDACMNVSFNVNKQKITHVSNDSMGAKGAQNWRLVGTQQ